MQTNNERERERERERNNLEQRMLLTSQQANDIEATSYQR